MPNNYSICHHNTCSKIAYIHLSTQQRASIVALFSPPSSSALHEQEHIKLKVVLLETVTGEQAGTNNDRAENFVVDG
jgi:hypothetical protein